MGNFLAVDQFVRHYPTTQDCCIRTVGYDDFVVVKPLLAYRIQNFYTWHFVLSGKGVLELNGRTWFVEKGQMFFIPPGVKMRYYPDEETPWEYVWFSLNGDAALQYGQAAGFSVQEPLKTVPFFSAVTSKLDGMFHRLTAENGSVFTVLSAFYGILELCSGYVPVPGIQSVKRYIDESFTLPGFSVEQLCYDAGISHAHLLRLFKQTYGVTIVKYLISKRLALACEMLRNTDLSVRSVAYSCGFSDEPHFMRTFKREFGMSALHYRKVNQNEQNPQTV